MREEKSVAADVYAGSGRMLSDDDIESRNDWESVEVSVVGITGEVTIIMETKSATNLSMKVKKLA